LPGIIILRTYFSNGGADVMKSHPGNIENEYPALDGTWMEVYLVNLNGDQRTRDDYAEPLSPRFYQPETDPLS
jgi:hypothetical protein